MSEHDLSQPHAFPAADSYTSNGTTIQNCSNWDHHPSIALCDTCGFTNAEQIRWQQHVIQQNFLESQKLYDKQRNLESRLAAFGKEVERLKTAQNCKGWENQCICDVCTKRQALESLAPVLKINDELQDQIQALEQRVSELQAVASLHEKGERDNQALQALLAECEGLLRVVRLAYLSNVMDRTMVSKINEYFERRKP